MSNHPFLRDLGSEREALAALMEPLKLGKILISGDVWTTEAAPIGYGRRIAELDAVIAWEERRNA